MEKFYVICINNQEYPVSLESRKIYEVITDEEAISKGLLRVIDESGEDYLYPQNIFEPVRDSEEMLFAQMIVRGLSDSDSNKRLSDEEMLRRIRTW